MDRVATKDVDEIEDMTLKALVLFRTKYIEFSKLPIYMVIETNAGFNGSFVKKILGVNWMIKLNLKYVSEDDSKIGIVKTKELTEDYILKMNIALIEGILFTNKKRHLFIINKKGKIRFHEKICTPNPSPAHKLDDQLKNEHKELNRFIFPAYDKDNPRYRSGGGISGKGWNGRDNDDAAVTTLMLNYFARELVKK